MFVIFGMFNCNKCLLVIDFCQGVGCEFLFDLVVIVDVFIQNFCVGVIDCMGFGEEVVRVCNVDVVYVLIVGFGQLGLFSGCGVYDLLIQVVLGIVYVQGQVFGGSGELQFVCFIVCDKVMVLIVSQVIIVVFFVCECGVGGQYVCFLMFDVVIVFYWFDMMWCQIFFGDDVIVMLDFVDSFYFMCMFDGWVICVVGIDVVFGFFCDVVECFDFKEDLCFVMLFDCMM